MPGSGNVDGVHIPSYPPQRNFGTGCIVRRSSATPVNRKKCMFLLWVDSGIKCAMSQLLWFVVLMLGFRDAAGSSMICEGCRVHTTGIPSSGRLKSIAAVLADTRPAEKDTIQFNESDEKRSVTMMADTVINACFSCKTGINRIIHDMNTPKIS